MFTNSVLNLVLFVSNGYNSGRVGCVSCLRFCRVSCCSVQSLTISLSDEEL